MSSNKKVVFVTGSSRGIGKAIAVEFAKNGYNVIVNSSKSKDELISTKNEITEMGYSCYGIIGDVSHYETCVKIFHEIKDIYGNVDVLVNNAGISYIGLFTEMSPDDWKNIININLNSVFNCTHIALMDMIKKKSGSIINISSIWGERGASCESVYSASKGGINSFTKSMAKELGPSNIRVNAISCGVIETKMNDFLTEDEKTLLAEEISLMRFGNPIEVAKLTLFLASDNSSYLTGQIISLDGGMI